MFVLVAEKLVSRHNVGSVRGGGCWGVRGMTLENVGEHAQSGGGSRAEGSVALLPLTITYD